MSYEEYKEIEEKILEDMRKAKEEIVQANISTDKAKETLKLGEKKLTILDIQYEFEKAESSNDVEEMSYELAQEYNKSVLFEEGMAEGFEKGFEKGYQMAFEKALEIVKENI